MEKFTMSRKESQQVPIFEKLLRRELSQEAASKILRITDRQVRNRLKSYKANGAAGLVHKNRGRESLLKWDYKERELSIEIIHARSPQAKGRMERINKTLQANQGNAIRKN